MKDLKLLNHLDILTLNYVDNIDLKKAVRAKIAASSLPSSV